MRGWIVLLFVVSTLNAGCIQSNENGDWDPRPVHRWKCADSGAHGFVMDTSSHPLAGVFVLFRPHENGDIEEAIDTDHSGAWELCHAWGTGATLTFEKTGYQSAVLRPQDDPDRHEFEIVLRSA